MGVTNVKRLKSKAYPLTARLIRSGVAAAEVGTALASRSSSSAPHLSLPQRLAAGAPVGFARSWAEHEMRVS